MFACDSETFLPLLNELADLLKSSSGTLATAESCTGGLLAALMTHLPGSSDYYLGGVSAYSNEAKHNLLQVPASLIAEHGAVSEEVAKAMALGAATALQSKYALSVTGIAGPGGAVPGKPVGTIWCGFHGFWGTVAKVWHLPHDRTRNRAEICQLALTTLIEYIRGQRG